MILRAALICLLSVFVTACVTTPRFATVYACEPGQNDVSRLAIHPNGRFVISLAYQDISGERKSAGIFAGRYKEALAFYDLSFESLGRPQIAALFKGTFGGGFVGDTSVYRIQKKISRIVIDGCRMNRLP